MNIIVAIDSFKGSLSSLQAGTAAEQGIRRALPDATVSVRPVADGGEGTVAALVSGLKGKYVTIPVTGPLGQPVEATYGILPDQTAVIEMAEAAGLPLVPPEARNPMKTTTYGVGELIRHALDQGAGILLLESVAVRPTMEVPVCCMHLAVIFAKRTERISHREPVSCQNLHRLTVQNLIRVLPKVTWQLPAT